MSSRIIFGPRRRPGRPAVITWHHLTEVPDDVRATMARAFAQWSRQDLGVEHLVDALLQDPKVTRQVVAWFGSSANARRVPDLCRAVKAAHPDISWRLTFRAVALFCGLYPRHVQRLFYSDRRTT